MHFRFLPFFGLSISSRSKCGHKGEQQQLKMHCVRKEGKKIFWLFLSQAVLITKNFFPKSKQSQHFCFAQKFGNPSFETPYSAIADFILWFCETLSFNLFLSDCFLMLSIKRRFSSPAFQNSGSNPN